MYSVKIIAPDGIAARNLFLDAPLKAEQERELLKPFGDDHWIDVSRFILPPPDDELFSWDRADYEDCYGHEYQEEQEIC